MNSVRGEIARGNEAYAASFPHAGLDVPPRRKIAVLTCIDARLDPIRALGLSIGDAHVIRNAGGRATEDAVRSLVISSWLLGTTEFIVVHHTDCGMQKFDDEELRQRILDEKGVDLGHTPFLTFDDLDESVREDVARLSSVGWLPDGVTVSGFVYDVSTGRLRPIA